MRARARVYASLPHAFAIVINFSNFSNFGKRFRLTAPRAAPSPPRSEPFSIRVETAYYVRGEVHGYRPRDSSRIIFLSGFRISPEMLSL